jgi:lipopolysaccharide export system protein LptC
MSILRSRRRQDRMTAFFPVIALAIFAAITFWLDARVSDSARSRIKPPATAPDQYMENFKIEKTSPKGRIEQTIVGVKATHFPDDSSTVVQLPQYNSVAEGKAPLGVRANSAVFKNDPNQKGVEQADFFGKVVAAQGAFQGRDPIVYESESLTVFPKTQRAVTKETTKTISGDRMMITQGIEFDADKQTAKTTEGFRLELKPGESRAP